MSISHKSAFITFEGIDGCGKSTQAQHLNDFLKSSGEETIIIREPGGTHVSEMIRDILLHSGGNELNARTEALLMTASRAQLTKEVIVPALESGKWVIADRYKDSTLAYQGGGRDLDHDWLVQLNAFATFDLDPDITFYIDVDPITGMSRRGGEPDRIESAGLSFQEQTRNRYLDLCKEFKNRIVKVDGTQSISTIQDQIINEMTKRKLLP